MRTYRSKQWYDAHQSMQNTSQSFGMSRLQKETWLRPYMPLTGKNPRVLLSHVLVSRVLFGHVLLGMRNRIM